MPDAQTLTDPDPDVATFGPQGGRVAWLLHHLEELTPAQAEQLAAATLAGGLTRVPDLAFSRPLRWLQVVAARDTARDTVWVAATANGGSDRWCADPAWAYVWGQAAIAAGQAALALGLGDLPGQHGVTSELIEARLAPVVAVFGAVPTATDGNC